MAAQTYSGMINLDRLGLYDSLIKQDVATALAGKSDVGHTHNSTAVIKFDTVAGWAARSSYIPVRGELIVITDYAQNSNGENVAALKVGDGLAYAVDLPIVMENIVEELAAHIADTTAHVTPSDRTFWNGKWSGYVSNSSPETLVFTTQ